MIKPFFKKSCRFDEIEYLTNIRLDQPYNKIMANEDPINMQDYRLSGNPMLYSKARKLMKRKVNRLKWLAEQQQRYRDIFREEPDDSQT